MFMSDKYRRPWSDAVNCTRRLTSAFDIYPSLSRVFLGDFTIINCSWTCASQFTTTLVFALDVFIANKRAYWPISDTAVNKVIMAGVQAWLFWRFGSISPLNTAKNYFGINDSCNEWQLPLIPKCPMCANLWPRRF